MAMSFVIIAAVLSVGAVGDEQDDTGRAALAEALSGFEQSTETRLCLSSYVIDDIDPIDDENWLITTRGRGSFLNQVSPGCSNAGSSFTYLQYSVPGGRLCRGDVVRVLDRSTSFSQGACILGEYQELTPVE